MASRPRSRRSIGFGFVEKPEGGSLAEMLDTFKQARARSLRDLDELGLTAGDLGRRGRHPDFGQVTIGQLLATWAIHDLNHLGQIVKVLARQHAEAVGPWRAFLGNSRAMKRPRPIERARRAG
jgi:hypothetical protein